MCNKTHLTLSLDENEIFINIIMITLDLTVLTCLHILFGTLSLGSHRLSAIPQTAGGPWGPTGKSYKVSQVLLSKTLTVKWVERWMCWGLQAYIACTGKLDMHSALGKLSQRLAENLPTLNDLRFFDVSNCSILLFSMWNQWFIHWAHCCKYVYRPRVVSNCIITYK